ncbi:molecular chaperone, partial [Citrobacter freundii]
LTMMVAPFGEQRFPLPSAVKGNVVWTAINDFGSETEQRKQSL